jgi:Flp pilus assembly protein TadG
MTMLRALWKSTRASTVAEFGLLTPLLLAFMIGTVDVGRFLWTCNRAEKATQMGARFAVVTDVVATPLVSHDFVVSDGVAQGDPVPQSAFDTISCDNSSGTATCTCTPTTLCPGDSTYDTTAFTNIVGRMQQFYPNIAAANVLISYQNAGIGYAGDPHGLNVAPLVTVKLRNMTFTPLLFRFFGNASVNLPAFSTALTLEDGTGTYSN